MVEEQGGLFEVEPVATPAVVAPRRLVLDVSVRQCPSTPPEPAGRAAFGVVLREADSGVRLAERAETFSAVGTDDEESPVTQAAFAGVNAGLDLAREADATAEVEVRATERPVVEQLATAAVPDGTIWTWVPRGDAPAADALADAALAGR